MDKCLMRTPLNLEGLESLRDEGTVTIDENMTFKNSVLSPQAGAEGQAVIMKNIILAYIKEKGSVSSEENQQKVLDFILERLDQTRSGSEMYGAVFLGLGHPEFNENHVADVTPISERQPISKVIIRDGTVSLELEGFYRIVNYEDRENPIQTRTTYSLEIPIGDIISGAAEEVFPTITVTKLD